MVVSRPLTPSSGRLDIISVVSARHYDIAQMIEMASPTESALQGDKLVFVYTTSSYMKYGGSCGLCRWRFFESFKDGRSWTVLKSLIPHPPE